MTASLPLEPLSPISLRAQWPEAHPGWLRPELELPSNVQARKEKSEETFIRTLAALSFFFAHLWMVTLPFLLQLPSRTGRQVQKLDGPGNSWPLDMERLLLLPLLWAGEGRGEGGNPGLGLGLQLSLCVPQGPWRRNH